MVSQDGPFVEANSIVTGGIDYENLIFIRFKFENQSNVVKLASSQSSYHVGGATGGAKQQKISSICLFHELLFTNIVKSPWLILSLGTFIEFKALAELDMPSKLLLPLCTLLLRVSLELKLPFVQTNYLNLKLSFFCFLHRLTPASKMIEIDDSKRHG